MCKKHNIPKPPIGYWQKIKLGKIVHPIPLPEISKEVREDIIIDPNAGNKSAVFREGEISKKFNSDNRYQNPIVVPDKLQNPHPLIVAAEKFLSESESDQYERVSTPYRTPSLDIQVFKNNIDRSLRIMDTLIKALESIGLSVKVGSDRPFHTLVLDQEETVRMRLIGKTIRKQHSPTQEGKNKSFLFTQQWDYNPTGELQFEIENLWNEGCKKKWSDSTRIKLEGQLNDIIIGILTSAELQRIKQKEWKEQIRVRDEEQRIRKEIEIQKQNEINRFEKLEQQVAQWLKAQNLRAFIEACEAKFIERSGSIQPDSPEAIWLQWANSYADSLDPLKKDIKL